MSINTHFEFQRRVAFHNLEHFARDGKVPITEAIKINYLCEHGKKYQE